MAISDALLKVLQAEGQRISEQPRDIDKVNNIFGSISNAANTYRKLKDENLARQKLTMDLEKSQRESELEKIRNRLPSQIQQPQMTRTAGIGLDAVEDYADPMTAKPKPTYSTGYSTAGLPRSLQLEEEKAEASTEALRSTSPYRQALADKAKNFQDSSGFRNSTRLRQEFINRPEVKDYVLVSPNIKAMDSLLQTALSGGMENKVAFDQAFITLFNKLTDPQSVVRESEYARTPENLPTLNRIAGAIQKIKSGGAGMTDDDRDALVTGAKIIGEERAKVFDDLRGEYELLSQRYSIDPNLVVGTLPSFSGFETTPVPPIPQTQSKASARPRPTGRTPEREARYQELLRKQREGTLQR